MRPDAAFRGAPHRMTTREHETLDPEKTRAVELLRRAQRFLLCGHMRPDGDCIGAQAALSRVLEASGKHVWIVNPDPPDGRYDYLVREVRFRTFTGSLPAHDVAVMLDFSELARTGVMEAPLRAAQSKKLVIDHHIHDGAAWWDERFVDVSAAATGLLVLRVAKLLDVPIDAVAAHGIFTSLVTDTGWFKYSNTDAETLSVAAEMVRHGVKPSEVFGAIYQRRSREHPPYVSRILSRLEYTADARLAVVHQPLSDSIDLDLVDSDEVLDILRSVKAVEVVLFLREMKDGTVKLSARSKTDYDVNALARRFGGGGHKKASGATIPGSMDDVKRAVVAAAIERFALDPKSTGGPASR